MRFTFPSLLKPSEYGYAYDDDFSTSRSFRNEPKDIVHYSSYWYLTYGDGQIPHSPDSQCPAACFQDWVASLATFLVAQHEPLAYREDLRGFTGSCLIRRQPVSRQDYLFYRDLRWKEGKTQWYSATERKVSLSSSKQYDKRYAKVPQFADGSLYGIFRLVTETVDSLGYPTARRMTALENYATLECLADHVGMDTGGYCGFPYELRDWKASLGEFADQAFNALRSVLQAAESLDLAGRSCGCIASNFARLLEKSEPAVAAAA